MLTKIITIGVYGFSAEGFFQALRTAEVDTFCDLRARRGVRGSTYAFANSRRLQDRLAQMDIAYVHRKDLAPSKDIRQRQYAEDKANKIAKRKRTELGSAFKNAYAEAVLSDFDPRSFSDELPPDARVVALFCVEKEPAACHRSLVAHKLQQGLDLPVEHIMPES
ncbi:MAG: DUF488 domain-containing protein [Candidatus Promineifilaceae bacterium]|nr:DUF488 domain-containing protein [Candidatus Promineifilaceae bacterium]